jgi:hypothetical protein
MRAVKCFSTRRKLFAEVIDFDEARRSGWVSFLAPGRIWPGERVDPVKLIK